MALAVGEPAPAPTTSFHPSRPAVVHRRSGRVHDGVRDGARDGGGEHGSRLGCSRLCNRHHLHQRFVHCLRADRAAAVLTASSAMCAKRRGGKGASRGRGRERGWTALPPPPPPPPSRRHSEGVVAPAERRATAVAAPAHLGRQRPVQPPSATADTATTCHSRWSGKGSNQRQRVNVRRQSQPRRHQGRDLQVTRSG